THAQVEEFHDARMADALRDLILLQESQKRVRLLGLPILLVAHDLQRDERARLLALREIDLGAGAGCDLAQAAVAADENATEALRFWNVAFHAPAQFWGSLRPITRSATLVPVGPVLTSAPSAASPATARRPQVSALTRPPAASVGPSVPSVPAARSISCG